MPNRDLEKENCAERTKLQDANNWLHTGEQNHKENTKRKSHRTNHATRGESNRGETKLTGTLESPARRRPSSQWGKTKWNPTGREERVRAGAKKQKSAETKKRRPICQTQQSRKENWAAQLGWDDQKIRVRKRAKSLEWHIAFPYFFFLAVESQLFCSTCLEICICKIIYFFFSLVKCQR